jgi:hypothetical protein
MDALRPFVPFQKAPLLVDLTDGDERVLEELEAGWAHLRGPIDSAEDDAGENVANAGALPTRWGLTMDMLAEAARGRWPEMDRPTLVALMADVGHLEHVPRERRYFLSAGAVEWGVGRNVRPKRGHVFPIIYPAHAEMVLSSLDWDRLKEHVGSLPGTGERRDFLVRHCGHLPVDALVRLSGAKKRTLELYLARQRNRNRWD